MDWVLWIGCQPPVQKTCVITKCYGQMDRVQMDRVPATRSKSQMDRVPATRSKSHPFKEPV